MAEAIAAGDVEAMKKAHVEFSHINGPQGEVEPGLRDRRIDELAFYNEGGGAAAASIRSITPEQIDLIRKSFELENGFMGNAEQAREGLVTHQPP